MLTSTELKLSSFLRYCLRGSIPAAFSAYGLRARWPTLRDDHYCPSPKVSLLGGLARPSEVGFLPTELFRPCPAAPIPQFSPPQCLDNLGTPAP